MSTPQYFRERYQELRRLGLCTWCKADAVPGRCHCATCARKSVEIVHKRKARNRQKFLRQRRMQHQRAYDEAAEAGLCTRCTERARDVDSLLCGRCRDLRHAEYIARVKPPTFVRRCSICKQTRHDKRRCPQRAVEAFTVNVVAYATARKCNFD